MKQDSFVVSEDDSGTRIDIFLTHKYKNKTRSAIQKWFDQNRILVNQHPSKPSYKLRFHDRIDVYPDLIQQSKDQQITPWEFPLDILLEDDWLLMINKPPHIIVHPGAGTQEHTVVHAALHHVPAMKNVGHPVRPGVVHRLDKETSGVLLLTKTEDAYQKFTTIFKNRSIRKFYRAAVYGHMQKPRGRIEKAMGRDPFNRKKMSVRARKRRPAVTLYSVAHSLEFGAVLDVEILTGRTHQIRVHLASENHPIIGDLKYGGGNWSRIPDPSLRNLLRKNAFFGLHAFALEFTHPFTGEFLRIEAPLPSLWDALV